ncbi:MAG: hypothetical protein V3V62_03670, partial [bacterium]
MEPAAWAGDLHEAIETFHKKGWTDGLPVVPPTEELLARFLEAAGLGEEDAVFRLPERRRTVTAGKIALNAIMAGCLPAYMPVLLAALEAMADPAYNLHSSAASTGGGAPFMVVNGPVRGEIGMNAGGNIFGPGCRANAAVGRAIRLVLMNCIGAVPGLLDRSTQGNPGKAGFTFAENEEASPWEPLHAERGLPAGGSAVTLFAAEGPHNIQNHYGRAHGILDTAAHTMSSLGSMSAGQSFLVFAPEHAALIGKEFPEKAAVKEYLFDRAHLPEALLRRTGKIDGPAWSKDPGKVRHALSPEDIFIVVAGGEAGGHSAWVPSWSRRRNGLAVTRPV